jgi:hypothetical protein
LSDALVTGTVDYYKVKFCDCFFTVDSLHTNLAIKIFDYRETLPAIILCIAFHSAVEFFNRLSFRMPTTAHGIRIVYLLMGIKPLTKDYMKKLLLTAFAAAAFSAAALAQERDSTRSESNEYRRDPIRTDSTNMNADSTEMRDDMQRNDVLNESDSLSQDREGESTDYRQDARERRDSLQQDAEQASDELRNDARQTRDSIRQDAERMGDDMEDDADQAKDSVEQDAKELGNYLKQSSDKAADKTREAGESVKQGAEQAGQSMQQGVQEAGNTIRNGNDRSLDTRQAEEDKTRTTAQDRENQKSDNTSNTGTMNSTSNMEGSSQNGNMGGTPSPVEVVDGKEGPNNEIVYKYNGELWYVDRETKQMVKADESKLKDSKHDVMVHEGTSTGDRADNNSKSTKAKKSKS